MVKVASRISSAYGRASWLTAMWAQRVAARVAANSPSAVPYNLRASAKIATRLRVPKIAEGARSAHSLSPNTFCTTWSSA